LEADRDRLRRPQRHVIERTWLDIFRIKIRRIEHISDHASIQDDQADAQKVMVRSPEQGSPASSAGLLGCSKTMEAQLRAAPGKRPKAECAPKGRDACAKKRGDPKLSPACHIEFELFC
jgi:hypothetical protein